MNRRSFLAFAGLAPLASKVLAAAPVPKPLCAGLKAWLPTTQVGMDWGGVDRSVLVITHVDRARGVVTFSAPMFLEAARRMEEQFQAPPMEFISPNEARRRLGLAPVPDWGEPIPNKEFAR